MNAQQRRGLFTHWCSGIFFHVYVVLIAVVKTANFLRTCFMYNPLMFNHGYNYQYGLYFLCLTTDFHCIVQTIVKLRIVFLYGIIIA